MNSRANAAIRCLPSLLLLLLFAVAVAPAALAAESRQIPAHITYQIEEGVYIDVGKEEGLTKGLKGQLVLEDGRTSPFEVVESTHASALLHLEGVDAFLGTELENLVVELVFQAVDRDIAPSRQREGSTGRSGEPTATQPFVPLLAPSAQAPSVAPHRNVGHGNLGANQSVLTGSDGQDRMMTRLYSSGGIDRLFGRRWSLNWSGNVRYRTGDGYRRHAEYETLQPLIYSVTLEHPLTGDGFVRLGRFLPFELPGVGYLDGGQMEIDTGGRWHFGAMAGLKPERIGLKLSVDEPTVVGYATFEAGKRSKNYYSGTAGLLGSLYQGEANRLALLFDQRVRLASRFDLFSTMQFDFGVADTTNSANQLSRLDLNASYRLSRNHTLRAGADHWERADTPVERDRLEIINDDLFDAGYWRYWVGARHRLPWNLRLNEELAYVTSEATDNDVRWRVGLTRTGLFGWQSANVAATVYNLKSSGSSGAGWLLSSYLPFFDGRYALRPVASMRWLDRDDGGDSLDVSYYAIYIDARFSKTWLVTGGFTQTVGDGAESTLFNLGLRYSW